MNKYHEGTNIINKKLVRVCAAVVAAVMCTGVISSIVLMGNNNSGTKDIPADTINMPKSENVSGFEQSWADNLKFKIGELWRLSLNSDLDVSIKNSINILNQNYDAVKLAEAVKQLREDFDVVADEYLAALQMELNFDDYISDREKYENAKFESEYAGEILTIEMIDEYLNELNTKEAEDIVNRTSKEQANLPDIENPNVQPKVPKAEDILPKNPAAEVQDEINSITNR